MDFETKKIWKRSTSLVVFISTELERIVKHRHSERRRMPKLKETTLFIQCKICIDMLQRKEREHLQQM